MNEFEGKVAVITGSASGIGRALAERAAQEGMRVVLADIEEPALLETAVALRARGADVLPVVTDVSLAESVEALAAQTLATYGAVHLLCNNAGVGAGMTAWESTLNDWRWCIGVNLMGVVHGLHYFVPAMLQHGEPSHIVNTASIAGLLAYHANAPYHATKHAIVAISEKLYYDLGAGQGPIGVSVLCPGWVNTRIMDSWRNRPAELQDGPASLEFTPQEMAVIEQYYRECAAGTPPGEIADQVWQAIRDKRFYILPHDEYNGFIAARSAALLAGENPPSLA